MPNFLLNSLKYAGICIAASTLEKLMLRQPTDIDPRYILSRIAGSLTAQFAERIVKEYVLFNDAQEIINKPAIGALAGGIKYIVNALIFSSSSTSIKLELGYGIINGGLYTMFANVSSIKFGQITTIETIEAVLRDGISSKICYSFASNLIVDTAVSKIGIDPAKMLDLFTLLRGNTLSIVINSGFLVYNTVESIHEQYGLSSDYHIYIAAAAGIGTAALGYAAMTMMPEMALVVGGILTLPIILNMISSYNNKPSIDIKQSDELPHNITQIADSNHFPENISNLPKEDVIKEYAESIGWDVETLIDIYNNISLDNITSF